MKRRFAWIVGSGTGTHRGPSWEKKLLSWLHEGAQERAFFDVESINEFLNRILGIQVAILNSLFECFTIEAQAKKSGETTKSIDSSKFRFKHVRI